MYTVLLLTFHIAWFISLVWEGSRRGRETSLANIFKASQPRGQASGSRAYERHEMQGVILKCTRHECFVFVNLRPHLLCIRSRHQFSLPEKKTKQKTAPTAGFEPMFIRLPERMRRNLLFIAHTCMLDSSSAPYLVVSLLCTLHLSLLLNLLVHQLLVRAEG